MKKVVMFNKVFRSIIVDTRDGGLPVSEGQAIKIKTVNEDTGETNVLEGVVQKLASKKMEVGSDNIPYPVVVMFSEISEIEVL